MQGAQSTRGLAEQIADVLLIPVLARVAEQHAFDPIAERGLARYGALNQHVQLGEEAQRLGNRDGAVPSKRGVPERAHGVVSGGSFVAAMSLRDDGLGPIPTCGLGAVFESIDHRAPVALGSGHAGRAALDADVGERGRTSAHPLLEDHLGPGRVREDRLRPQARLRRERLQDKAQLGQRATPARLPERYPGANGIDARYAWGFAGGDGAGIGFVDMEQGWNLNHEDLAGAGITIISGLNHSYPWHGTSVLGEVLMVDNTIGGVGIAPSSTGRVVSQWRPGGGYNTPDAILDAVSHMVFGDVLLLEAQEYSPVDSSYFWPVEIADATHAAIRLATALGVVVVDLQRFDDVHQQREVGRGVAGLQP